MNNKRLEEIISEAIKNVITNSGVLNPSEQDIGNTVKLYTRNELSNIMLQEIWDILCLSYESIGGIKTYNSYQDFLNKIRYAKIIVENKHVIACSVYRKIEGSYKMVAIGCNQEPNGKRGIETIVNSDIVDSGMHYWAEVSGAIEHYFKKYNGYPMPNILAPKVLSISENLIELLPDQVHYKRQIGADKEIFTKMIYGMKSEEIFNEAIQAVVSYDDFMKQVNKLDESNGQYTPKQCIYIIENIYRNHEENGFNELIPTWYYALKTSVKILKSIEEKDDTINDYIEYGEYLLKNMPLLKLNKLELRQK